MSCSVFYENIEQKVDVRITGSMIEVSLNNTAYVLNEADIAIESAELSTMERWPYWNEKSLKNDVAMFWYWNVLTTIIAILFLRIHIGFLIKRNTQHVLFLLIHHWNISYLCDLTILKSFIMTSSTRFLKQVHIWITTITEMMIRGQ